MTDNATSKIGVSFCGGGITGAMYEVGCLAALEENFENFSASDFGAYVGVSSGATVAACFAGGLNAQRVYRALLDPADDFFPLRRQHLLRFDGAEWKRVVSSGLEALRRLFATASSQLLTLDVWTEIDRFYDSLPAGFFTTDTYEKFLQEFFIRRGIGTSFSELIRPLIVVANDLDAGRRVLFGIDELREIPIARAVSASSAVPILYAPVRVGDRDYFSGDVGDIAHVDVLQQLGCDLMLVVNAMVPIASDIEARDVPTGHGLRNRIRDKGLLWVYYQSERMAAAARLSQGLDLYRRSNPHSRVILLQPDPDDTIMFLHSPMNFAARRVILEHGYANTTRALRAPNSILRASLEAHGLVFRNSV